ncbi:MAG: mechanosensitive ion channel [Finegoldia sp.]|nr:mechanosensitive ion channel [Finegoldia sp.]
MDQIYQYIQQLFMRPDGTYNFFGKIVLSLIAIVVARIAIRVLEYITERLIRNHEEASDYRSVTASKLISNVLRSLVYFFLALRILEIFGVNTAKIIATAGIGGIAIGFGAQSIVKDFISGLALLLENQYQVGDYVVINGHEGCVSEVGLRLTTIIDYDGTTHFISNGEINQVSNLSKNPHRIDVKLYAPVDTDLKDIEELVDQVGSQMKADHEDIADKPYIAAMAPVGSYGMNIRIFAHSSTDNYFSYEKELYRRLIEGAKEKQIALTPNYKLGEREGEDHGQI